MGARRGARSRPPNPKKAPESSTCQRLPGPENEDAMSIANGTAASKQRWTGARLTAEEIANAPASGAEEWEGGGRRAAPRMRTKTRV